MPSSAGRWLFESVADDIYFHDLEKRCGIPLYEAATSNFSILSPRDIKSIRDLMLELYAARTAIEGKLDSLQEEHSLLKRIDEFKKFKSVEDRRRILQLSEQISGLGFDLETVLPARLET